MPILNRAPPNRTRFYVESANAQGPDNPQLRALHCTYLLSADKSCLLFQMFGVEIYSFLPDDQRDRCNFPRQSETSRRWLYPLGQQSLV